MTEQQIRDYFGARLIYTFAGSTRELSQFLADTQASLNYIITGDTVYFVADTEVVGPSVTIFADNR